MPHLIFVLGTLKQGFRNFHVNRGRRVGGDVVTIAPYPLYGIGPRHLPWLLDRPGQGQPVVGPLFEVDDDTLAAMGTPTGRYPLPATRYPLAGGAQRLEFARGPAGRRPASVNTCSARPGPGAIKPTVACGRGSRWALKAGCRAARR